jgi:hypothetical protein
MRTINDTPPQLRELDGVIAQLRHAYSHLVNCRVDTLDEFGRGLIAPQIRKLEKLRRELSE